MSTELIIFYWRDIPAQVMAKQGRTSAKVKLAERFEQAIDRAAMRAGRGSSDAYMEDWRRERSACEAGDLDEIARAQALQIESEYDDKRLEQLIKHKGLTAPLDNN